ncbi:MAG TPA: winged helix-turn-helix domain-containing protein [Nitrososphaeraceae archaeon]|nr:winged helix-turn-helix domain-containing protein [Nitrososphaeraceae archaeon]
MDFTGNNVPSRGRYPYPNNNDKNNNNYFDPRLKRILWFLFASTRGGFTRAKIINLINEVPANANQISTNLDLNYKTVIHHLNVLIKNGLIITDDKEAYGATYFPTPLMEQNFQLFNEILEKIKKT